MSINIKHLNLIKPASWGTPSETSSVGCLDWRLENLSSAVRGQKWWRSHTTGVIITVRNLIIIIKSRVSGLQDTSSKEVFLRLNIINLFNLFVLFQCFYIINAALSWCSIVFLSLWNEMTVYLEYYSRFQNVLRSKVCVTCNSRLDEAPSTG